MLQYTLYITEYTLCYRINSMLQCKSMLQDKLLCYRIQCMLQYTFCVTVYCLHYSIQSTLQYTVYITVYILCYSIQSTLQYTVYVTVYNLCYSIQTMLRLPSPPCSRFLWSFPTEIFMYAIFLISVLCPAVFCFLIIEIKWSRWRMGIMKLLVMYSLPCLYMQSPQSAYVTGTYSYFVFITPTEKVIWYNFNIQA